MNSKNNRAPPICYVKLCPLFQSHQWIQTEVTAWKCSIWVKISNFFVLCDLEIWQMVLKNNRAPLLCYFKLCASLHRLQSIQTGVTVQKRPIRVKICDFFVPGDLEIWQMTLTNNRLPFLYHFKLCASFHNHWWIQTRVTVRKHPFWVKIGDFWSHVTLKFDGWPWKTIGHLFYPTSSYVHHFVDICEFKLELQSGNRQIGAKFIFTSVTLTFDLDFLHGHDVCQWQ